MHKSTCCVCRFQSAIQCFFVVHCSPSLLHDFGGMSVGEETWTSGQSQHG